MRQRPKRDARIFEEAGVMYSHASEANSTPVEIVFSPDFKLYPYDWQSPSGVTGETAIYTTSEEAFRTLMRRWNRDGWRYTPHRTLLHGYTMCDCDSKCPILP